MSFLLVLTGISYLRISFYRESTCYDILNIVYTVYIVKCMFIASKVDFKSLEFYDTFFLEIDILQNLPWNLSLFES